MHDHHAPAESNAAEYLKFFSLIVSISLLSWLFFEVSDGSGWMDAIRWFMGVFMTVFASFKIAGYDMFVMMFPMYDLLAKRSKLYAMAYPFIEFSLGLMHMIDTAETVRSIAVIFFMGIGAAGIIRTVFIKKQTIHCACLGNIIKLPLSTVSLGEDVLMVVAATVLLIL